MHFFVAALCLFPLLAAGTARAQGSPLAPSPLAEAAEPSVEGAKLQLRGSGWYQFGRIMHSTDTLSPTYNYQGNWQQNFGAQFTVIADIDESLQGAMGLGGYQTHSPQGRQTASASSANYVFIPYITEARLTWFVGDREAPPLKFDFGLFPFQYATDTRNLGAYLLRGPVYPGILFSEFESKTIDPTVANVLGFHARHNVGEIFSHDLLLRSEIDLPPVYDVSFIYIANLMLGKVFEIGGGVNFHRYLPMIAGVTNLTDSGFTLTNPATVVDPGQEAHPYYGNYAAFDSAGNATRLSHQGIKLMGRASLDLKPLFGIESWGPRDLKFWAEAAVIGVKDYPGVYPKIGERIPIAFGFGVPTAGLLDELVVEVEHYKAPFRDDYKRLVSDASPIPMSNKNYGNRRADPTGNVFDDNRPSSTIPFADPFDIHDMHKDDLKWSVYASKTFQGTLRLSLQAANDHFRPYNHVNTDATQVERLESAFTTMKDWYLMFRLGFFFQ